MAGPQTPPLLGRAEHSAISRYTPPVYTCSGEDLELPPRHATETSSRAGTSPVYRNHDEKGAASAL